MYLINKKRLILGLFFYIKVYKMIKNISQEIIECSFIKYVNTRCIKIETNIINYYNVHIHCN